MNEKKKDMKYDRLEEQYYRYLSNSISSYFWPHFSFMVLETI
jgi:hypothetical protein